MGNPAKKNNNEIEARREQEKVAERKQWQEEFVARQQLVQKQMEHRRKMRKVPKVAWAFMALWGSVFVIACLLFIMSFNPATSGIVTKIIGAFKVF